MRELAKLTHTDSQTIRYYEKIGLLPAPKRETNSYRFYDERSVMALEFIKTCRRLGFGIEDVRQLQSLKNKPLSDHHHADALALTHLTKVNNKINELHKIKRFLETIAQCDQNADECQVLTLLHKLTRQKNTAQMSGVSW